jgi:hypothetical protein
VYRTVCGQEILDGKDSIGGTHALTNGAKVATTIERNGREIEQPLEARIHQNELAEGGEAAESTQTIGVIESGGS